MGYVREGGGGVLQIWVGLSGLCWKAQTPSLEKLLNRAISQRRKLSVEKSLLGTRVVGHFVSGGHSGIPCSV